MNRRRLTLASSTRQKQVPIVLKRASASVVGSETTMIARAMSIACGLTADRTLLDYEQACDLVAWYERGIPKPPTRWQRVRAALGFPMKD